MPYCSKCGTAVDDTDMFCNDCGHNLFEPAIDKTSQAVQVENSDLKSNDDNNVKEGSQTLNERTLRSRLQGMDDYEFEHFVADLWKRMGWETEVSQASVDAGIDVIATQEKPYSQKQVIQAKRYSDSTTVGGPHIQQYASLKHQVPNADSVVIITTSSFTNNAEARAEELNVKLVDGEGLVAIIDDIDAYDIVDEYLGIQYLTNSQKNGLIDDNSLEHTQQSITTHERTSSYLSSSSSSVKSNEFEKQIEDEKVEGWKVKKDGDERVILIKPNYGSLGEHILIALLTLWWTLGVGNVIWAAYRYLTNSAEKIIRDEQATVDHPETTVCQSCGKPVKEISERCPHCGFQDQQTKPNDLLDSTSSKAEEHDPSQYETTVSDSWWYGIAGGTILWVFMFMISGSLGGSLGTFGALLFFVAWIGLPLSAYFDMQYIRANSKWNPSTIVWVIALAVWFVNIIVGAAYLYRRHGVLGEP